MLILEEIKKQLQPPSTGFLSGVYDATFLGKLFPKFRENVVISKSGEHITH